MWWFQQRLQIIRDPTNRTNGQMISSELVAIFWPSFPRYHPQYTVHIYPHPLLQLPCKRHNAIILSKRLFTKTPMAANEENPIPSHTIPSRRTPREEYRVFRKFNQALDDENNQGNVPDIEDEWYAFIKVLNSCVPSFPSLAFLPLIQFTFLFFSFLFSFNPPRSLNYGRLFAG